MNKLQHIQISKKLLCVENHLGENGDDCIIISESKVFLEKLLLPKDRQLINNTCVKKFDLRRKLYLKSLPKRKGTQKHTYKIACVLTILIHAYVSSTIH